MLIKLIRHGESKANSGDVHTSQVGDAYIELTDNGKQQALAAGENLGSGFLENCLIYCSPYTRTRQTTNALLNGAKVQKESIKIYEDPRLREQEFGYGNDIDLAKQHPLRKIHGWFYYRHENGESAADCYDRTSAFLESMMRQLERRPSDKILIICHGLTIRTFVMRFLHLTVEEFESIANPSNCDIITINKKGDIQNPLFSNGRWAVKGLSLRH